ncbi:TPR-like protein [Athelia psychrophila]|uniref:TPR-like protein n=1 Tax=Athelia psychrophila TaxID=1759441 RepID=A0A166F4B5_9AGAM|nr:TPR-like protein [Fibularhizoctonia sp. CBS 109695]
MSRAILSTYTTVHQVRPLDDAFKRSLSDDLPVLSSSLSVPPPSQPSPPDIWFGRDEIVSTLAGIIAVNENPRLAILGAGGMGKTSTALHVTHHEAVIARYKDRIFFLACDAATSADLLASLILQVIGVSVGAEKNLLTALHVALKCAPPTLLLLDNFESLWEAEKDHNAIRDLLQKIANSRSSTLIITMRATTPPPGIRWTFFESLPPLHASSAKEIFLAINAAFCDGSDDGDEVLDELLMELDYVPLAIHLLAHVSTDTPPRLVLKQWQKQRTRMLSLDSYTIDKLESVDVSISLSMESLDVNRNSDAIQLLGMLCLLPDGLLRWQDRLEVIEKTFETASSNLFLLRKFALVYTTGAKLGVLSPIRHFILQHYPPDSQHVRCISNIIWELVYTHAMVDFGPKFHGAVEALSLEMGNIGNLIDHAIACDPGEIIVDISIQMSFHLSRTYPSSHLSTHARDLFLEISDGLGAAYCSQRLGDILRMQNNYSEATAILTDARAKFIEIGKHLSAAQCSRSLGEIRQMQNNYSEAAAILTDARAQFTEIGNHLGAARCSQSLGETLQMQNNYPEATAILTDARAQFIDIGDQLGVAQCSQRLGDILMIQHSFSEATAILTDARAKFIPIRDRLGAAQCSRSLGEILQMQRNYSEATTILTDARAQFIEIGDRLGAAQCSQRLGDILMMQNNHSEATAILTDARDKFIQIENRLGAAQCSRSLGDILQIQNNYPEATAILTDARAQFIEIGNRLGAARCSQSLGNILQMQNSYSEATVVLIDARAQFIEFGGHLGAAQCSQSLGDILTMQNNYFEATAIFTDAQTQFIEIGDRLGAAQCSRKLGNILQMQRNCSEGTGILTDARAQLIEIGSRLDDSGCSA